MFVIIYNTYSVFCNGTQHTASLLDQKKNFLLGFEVIEVKHAALPLKQSLPALYEHFKNSYRENSREHNKKVKIFGT